jgi:hypothetical protein
MTEKGFLELNLEELKVLASNWAQEHDAIEKITLYRGSSDSEARYVFIATVAPFPDEEARKKLQSDTHIPVQGENSLVLETINYYNWAAPDCLQIEDDLKSAYKDLESAYKRSAFIRDEWIWFPIKPGEEIPHDLVNDNFLVTLYEKFKQKRNLTPSQEDKKACQKIDYYEQLNLTELKIMAEGWANRFSVIKQITLYRAYRDGKYVLDVRITERREADDRDKIEHRYFQEYWIDKACYLDRFYDVYKTPDTDYYGDWLFLMPEVVGKPLLKDDQVFTDSRFVLFPRDDVDADNKSIPGTMSQAEHFPHLLKKQLELYALDWVTKYHDVPIKSIVLYTYISQYEKYSKVPINVQYAVVFEIDETKENEPSWRLNEAELAEYHRKQITGKIPATPYEKLWADTRATMGDAAIVRPAAFKNVYRQSPSGHYKGEWNFILKFLKTELPKGVRKDRPSWILFPSKQVKEIPKKKLRPNQQDKIDCKKIAEEAWGKYPMLDIVHMIKLPAIKKIVGKLYTGRKTVHDWLSEVAPPRAKRGGIRSPEMRSEQKKLCEKLGIKHDFKL